MGLDRMRELGGCEFDGMRKDKGCIEFGACSPEWAGAPSTIDGPTFIFLYNPQGHPELSLDPQCNAVQGPVSACHNRS